MENSGQKSNHRRAHGVIRGDLQEQEEFSALIGGPLGPFNGRQPLGKIPRVQRMGRDPKGLFRLEIPKTNFSWDLPWDLLGQCRSLGIFTGTIQKPWAFAWDLLGGYSSLGIHLGRSWCLGIYWDASGALGST